MTQSIHEQIGILPTIEAEGHFGAVGLQMLRADSMPSSHDAALQERECRFHGVGMRVSLDVNFQTVADCLVALRISQVLCGASVGIEIIGHENVHILADIFADVARKCAGLNICRMEKAEFSAALSDSDNNLFFSRVRPTALTVAYTANVGFVHFHRAVQHGAVNLAHGGANPVAEIPGGLVTHSERALNLASGHSLFRFAEQERGNEPFVQRQVRIIEDRASGYSELVVTVLAVEELFVGFEFYHVRLAAGAPRAFGPAQPDKQFAASFVGRKQRVYVN